MRDRIRSAFRRNNMPVYDPTYVYAPWKKWVFLAIGLVVGAGLVWLWFTNDQQPRVQESLESVAVPVAAAEPTKDYVAVEKVVDGDTLDVSLNGKTERLRLIGVDTPETVDPRTTVQCFGKEASDKAKSILEGAKVHLEQDASQGERDKYGRLLMYVFLEDGTNFNQHMIAEGYAHEYTYNLPYKYQSEFKAAQASASAANKGLWSPSTCSGDTSTAAPTAAAAPQPAVTSRQSTPVPSRSSEATSVYYKNCAAARAAGAAPVYAGDPGYRSALDRDNDGVGCE